MEPPALRPRQVADALGVSVDTVRRWADSGRLATRRSPGGQRQIEGADLARFLEETASPPEAELTGGASARNRLRGVVTRVKKDSVMAQVDIHCRGYRIVSLMTREAADELGLAPGVLAVAVVKSTNVVVELARPA